MYAVLAVLFAKVIVKIKEAPFFMAHGVVVLCELPVVVTLLCEFHQLCYVNRHFRVQLTDSSPH